MSKQTLTDWIPLSTPPVRKGVYEVLSASGSPYPYPFGYWDGERFNGCSKTPQEAFKERYLPSYSLSNPGNFWRGVYKATGEQA